MESSFRIVVDIVTSLARAASSVFLEQRFQTLEFIGFGTEMGKVSVTASIFLGDLFLHLGSIVAVERVTFDESCRYFLSCEDLLKCGLNSRRTRARRPSDCDDGKPF